MTVSVVRLLRHATSQVSKSATAAKACLMHHEIPLNGRPKLNIIVFYFGALLANLVTLLCLIRFIQILPRASQTSALTMLLRNNESRCQ